MPTPTASNYASAYAKGRRAAEERMPAKNPYRPGSDAFLAWSDGHYDGQSARNIAIERHSAMIWSHAEEARQGEQAAR